MKAFYSGFEFRAAVEEVLGKINTSLGLHKITVQWTHEVQTAAINDSGRVLLADVQDDSRIPHATLLRYIGMGAHELCHHSYTDWNVVFAASHDRLLAQLHNAVEDAYIERRAIQSGLTGNIQALFSSLIDGMVAEALADVTDWGNPAQYPFALAVYLRDHATTKVPLAPGLEPIFEEAARQFKSCGSSADALRIAEWVYGQLKFLPEKNKQSKQNKQNKQQAKPQEGTQKGRLGRGVPLQGQQQQGAAKTAVADRRDPPGGHLFPGQVDHQAQKQGHQDSALGSDRSGIELQR